MAKDKLEPETNEHWGIFGGLFNPIHHGHLITTRTCLETEPLDRIIFVPTDNPPHRKAPSVPVDHRMAMTEKAVSPQEGFFVSKIETEHAGPSYTHDTLKKLNNKYPDVELTLIVGLDELESFEEWHRWQDLLERVNVCALRRPGYSTESVEERILEAVRIVDVPFIQISSTNVRKRVSNNNPIHYLVPDSVNSHIEEHDLYRG